MVIHRKLSGSLWFALLLLLTGSASGQLLSPAAGVGPVMPSASTELNGPHIRVLLSQPVYRISTDRKTGAPQMPTNVKAFAEPVNWPANAPKPTLFTWRVLLNWDFAPFPTQHCIGTRTFTALSPFKI